MASNQRHKETYVIPNGEIILVPLEANLQVVIPGDDVDKLFENVIAFSLGNIIDVGNVRTNSKDGFPASNWVGADNRVNSLKFISNVLWCTTLIGVDFESVGFGGVVEARLGICGGQTLVEPLERLGKTVINLNKH
jgi:hypothetical protein